MLGYLNKIIIFRSHLRKYAMHFGRREKLKTQKDKMNISTKYSLYAMKKACGTLAYTIYKISFIQDEQKGRLILTEFISLKTKFATHLFPSPAKNKNDSFFTESDF